MSHDRLNLLRDEAAAMTPAFSETLHQQTMSRIHALRAETLSAGRARSAGVTARWFDPHWFTGLVGACAVAVMIMMVVRPRPAALSKDAPAQVLTAIADIRDATAPFKVRIGRPIQRAHEQFSLLRGDAAQFGNFVFRQFDYLPAP